MISNVIPKKNVMSSLQWKYPFRYLNIPKFNYTALNAFNFFTTTALDAGALVESCTHRSHSRFNSTSVIGYR